MIISMNTLLNKLRSMAMIKESDEAVTIHRLTQAAFLDYIEIEMKKKILKAASRMVYSVFPKQHLGDPLLPNWAACSKYAMHARSLALNYHSAYKENNSLPVPAQFVQLLCNCAW